MLTVLACGMGCGETDLELSFGWSKNYMTRLRISACVCLGRRGSCISGGTIGYMTCIGSPNGSMWSPVCNGHMGIWMVLGWVRCQL